MSVVRLDVAVFGSTPLAKLLAGLIAGAHGKRVAIIGDSDATFRLTQGADLSVAPLTRPEAWALLGHTVPETTRLLSRIGAKSGQLRLDPIFYARGAFGREALAHIRHMATGFGHAAERVPEDVLGEDFEGLVLRDAVLLLRPQLEPLLDNWLRSLGVLALRRGQSHIELTPEGGVHIAGESGMEAQLAVLADDEAIIDYLGSAALGHRIVTTQVTSILTEPTSALPSPFMVEIEDGAHLLQRPSGSIAAVAVGAPPLAVSVVGRLLARHRHLRRAGQVAFTRLTPSDGAPLVGRFDGGPTIMAGFGLPVAFLAPAIARWIAGAASPSEEAWFAAHSLDRDMARSGVAEVAPPRAIEAFA
jgi:hypothetical protein